MAEENMKKARYIIKKWRVNAGEFGKIPTLFSADREEAMIFLEASIGLQQAMNYYAKLGKDSDKLVGAQALMKIGMNRLMFEFYSILSANRKNFGSESFYSRSSSNIPLFDNGVSENHEKTALATTPSSEAGRAVKDLKSIAKCMIRCGYGKECMDIYRIVRKSVVDETLYYLGIERLSCTQLEKMEWTVLEARIKRWLHAVKIAVQSLFLRDKILCSTVFSSSEKVAAACFAGVSRDAAVDLFAFGENVSKCRKIQSPEKIFRLLDLYEVISNLCPDIDFIFPGETFEAVRSQVAATQMKLSVAVRAIFGHFEEAILKDSSKPPPGGAIHPLARYVMNFLVFLGDYSAAISGIVANWPLQVHFPSKFRFSGGKSDSSSAEVSRRLAWLLLVLLCKVDGKAAAYNDVALSYLFLANNLNYVVSKVRNSKLALLIGHDWIRSHDLKVKTYLSNYLRIGWSNVISAVPGDPAAATPVRECIEKFDVSFREASKKQSSWVIPDPKLREEVKISLAQRIIPGYRVLYRQSRGLIVKYAPEDLDNHLTALFLGKSCKESRSR